MSDVSWIGADWGTSRLRVWALDSGNQVVAQASSESGMSTLKPDQFETALLEVAGGWLTLERVMPVIACGMVGARQGWIEAAYRMVPAPPLASGLFTHAPTVDPRVKVSIIAGMARNDPADVMRGEETQIAGLLADRGDFSGTMCMPGTHCKWVSFAGGLITDFKTCMTGEVFALLSRHSVLRHSLTGSDLDMAEFETAVAAALDTPGDALARLFSIRADDLLNGTPADVARARLSAWLIAAEIQAMHALWQVGPVIIIGSEGLAGLYRRALRMAGADVSVADGTNLTVRGLIAAKTLLERT